MFPSSQPPAGVHCPALLVAAPASGQGKTTATAALARWHRRQGRRVQVFKTGPDFLDPMVLERACGQPVHVLDLWMGGEAHCRDLLGRAAADADLVLVEGVMGLFDGTASSADLAQRFGLPVMAVIDASAMAQTFGAVAHGLATFRPGLPFAGVLANRVGSDAHARMLRESLPAGVTWFGALPRDDRITVPSRHLGLVAADEVAGLQDRIEHAADAIGRTAPVLPPPVRFERPVAVAPTRALAGARIAIARDAAFSFLYPANVDTLRALGAEPRFFSPLAGEALPEADALYLPGGYPELHLDALAAATAFRASVHAHHARGRPIVAECGGMLALLETLTDHAGHSAPMLGLLPGHAEMTRGLVNLGLQSADLPEGMLRGHTFHHARMASPLSPLTVTRAHRDHGRGEAVYRQGRLHASFLHLYFPSNPDAVARLFAPGEAAR